MISTLLLVFGTAAAVKFPLMNSVALQMKAGGSLEDVLDLLYDLQEKNEDEQTQADARNVTEQQDCDDTIAEYTQQIADNLVTLNNAQDHQQFVEDELDTTRDGIAYIQKQLEDNAAKLDKLKAQRCEENQSFIQSLVEHKEALTVVQELRDEIQNGDGDASLLLEMSDRLFGYAHLFRGKANILAQVRQQFGDDFYKESYDVNQVDEHIDNDQDTISYYDTDHVTNQRAKLSGDTDTDLLYYLDQLEAHLKVAIQTLEDNEVRSSHDFAQYTIDYTRESEELTADLERKENYETKLVQDLEVAEQYTATSQKNYDNSVQALADKEEECEHKRQYYFRENDRRDDEDVNIAEAIRIFETSVPELSGYTHDRANAHSDFQSTATPSRRTSSFSHSRTEYQETGGYSHAEL
mmetsp:Transcript_32669/g.56775  ORF Transcript_32669/g.56775 Transcript_32669/m.56775 type:complete len:409 (+) Transcript_32669:19-1245(+)